MRKLKLFFACLLMAVLSIGQVWGAVYFEDTFSNVGTGSSGNILPRDGWSGSGTTAPQYNTGVRIGASSSGATLTKTAMSNIEGTISLKVTIYVSRYNTNANTLTVTATNGTIASATLAENVSTGSGLTDGTLTIKPSENAGVANTTAAATWTDAYKTEFTITGASSSTTIVFSSDKRLVLGPVKIEDAASTPSTCTSEITITKADDPANGTFALDNSGTVCIDEGNATVNVTATPADHYHLASVTSTVGTIGTISGNTCEITDIDADTEIGVTFAEDTKYVVTWNVNGNEDTKTNVYAGEKPVFPATPAACDATSTTFIGWATAPWTGKLADLSEKTVYTSASAMPDVDAAVTYYAVFAKSSGSASELFSWAGGSSSDFKALEGVTLSADGTDYAASHSPYLIKWNGTGKYAIISVASQPGKVSAGFKMIGGGTTSTITVQEADDAESPFTDVENLAISGSSNDVVNIESTQAFKSTTRAIKLYYTKGSNVGLGPISIEGAVSYEDYMTTCCTQYNVNIAAGIENGSVSADVAKACEGATVTLTFTPAGGYHLDSWSLNGTAQNIAVNTFSMPAAAATVSATFAHDDCANLAAPTLDEITKSYNSATIAWNEVADAEEYAVSVVNHVTSASIFAGNVDALSKALADLEPETQYDYSIMAVGDGSVKCADGNGVLEGNFTTESLPTAHLTLIDPSGTHASSGNYAILTPFNLPSTAAACSKSFRGWDANSECASAPTYAKGAEFTFQNTDAVILYAVYADETPGEATLTKLGSNYAPTAGDKLVIVGVDGDDQYALYRETQSSSYVKNWAFDNNVATVAADAKKYVILEAATNGKFYLGDATNGYVYSSSSNNLSVDASNKTEWTIAWDNNASAFTFSQGKYLSCRSDLSGTNQYLYRLAGGTPAGIYKLDVYKYATSASTYDNYSTTCVAAPTAEPASASIAVAAAGGEGTLGVSYENVNLAGVTVALYNNEACTEAFDGGWLTASIAGDDKHIAYNAQANTSYNDARTAYIKLTAPETNGAANPAVVVIPVEQAKKPAVFASLVDLVAAELASGTEVTVSFSNVMITEVYETNAGYRYGLYLNVKDKDGENDIELFYNKQGDSEQVPDTWVKNGYVSATNLVTTWTEYKGQWELAMQDATWSWENGDITYGAPKAVSSVVVSGDPTKKAYVDGEKFNPAGLTVTVNYTVGDPEVIAVTDADWEFTPERLAKGETEISVKATYNTVQSAAFNVTGLTVGDIQLKTVAEFIAAGNADMRCYLEGIVSDIETGNKLKYGNFNLTDASGAIYVYGCLTSEGVAEKFDELGIANGDKIKVIAEDYDYYNSKHEAKNVVFVSKKPVATMTFDPMAMETGDVETMAPKTITVAEASAVAYSIKEGSDDCVSLDGAQITATATGTATIVATLTETTEYVGTSVEFTVTVTAPDTRKIATASAFEAISGDMTPTDIAFAAYKGDGTTTPVINNSNIRLYKPASGKSTGGYLTLTAKIGCTIDQVQIIFNGNSTAAYCKNDEALPTEAFITGQTELLTAATLGAQSVSVVNLKDGSIDVKSIKVWYNGDPLAVDHYILGGTYATEFEQYGEFNYEGLTVTAAYDAEETITEPVSGFEVIADLSTAGAAKAEVYLGEDKLTEYDITVTPTAKLDPEIGWSPADNIVMTEGDEFTAPAWQNPHSVSVSFESTNTSVATVSNAGVITIKGLGSTTINATFAGDETYYSANPSLTVTVNAAVEDLMGNWVVASSVAAGDRIIIANVAVGTSVKTMGAQNGNYRDEVASTVSNNIMTPADGTKVFTLIDASTIDANYNGFALRATNGKYLSAASSSSNNIKEVASVSDANAVWNIVISEGKAAIVAQGSYSRKVIRYNSSQPRFSCYAESNDMKDVVIYKRAFDYEREIAQGVLSTTCLPNGGVIYGASIFEVAYMDYEADDTTPHKIYFDEVEGGIMEAGVPYIVLANEGSEKFGVYYSDNENKAAQSKNGLVGYIGDGKYLAENDYFIYNNMFYYVSATDADTRVHISNNRAYINLSDVPGYNNEPISVPAPGRRRVSLGNGAPKVATGIDALNASDKPVKMIIDGQLFIIRGEKMFNANGQLVK